MPPTHTDEGIVLAPRLRRALPARRPGAVAVPRVALRHHLITDAPEHAGYLLKDRVSDIAVLVDALLRVSRASAWSTRRSCSG